MPNLVEQTVSGVRLDCNHPDPHAPNDELILQKIADAWQLLHNEAANSQPGWELLSTDVAIAGGHTPDVLVLPHDRFGKPVRVHLLDASKPEGQNFLEALTIVRLPELPNPDTESAFRRIAFDRKDGGDPFFRLSPPLAETEPDRFVRIWYETGEIEENGQTVLPAFPQFHRYLRRLASLAVLPYCEWSNYCDADMKKVEKLGLFKDMQSRLEPTLIAASAREEKQWKLFIATGFADGDGGLREYADWSRNEY